MKTLPPLGVTLSILLLSTTASAQDVANSLCTTTDKAGKASSAFKMVAQLKEGGRRSVSISTTAIAKGSIKSAKFVSLARSTKDLPDFQKPGGDGDVHFEALDSRPRTRGDRYEFILSIMDNDGALTEGKLNVTSRATRKKSQYKIQCTNEFK